LFEAIAIPIITKLRDYSLLFDNKKESHRVTPPVQSGNIHLIQYR